MMDLATLNYVNREVALEAAEENRVPFVITAADADALMAGDFSAVDIPNLGPYLPPNWERVQLDENGRGVYMGDNDGYGAYFVDKSGMGGAGEPAISVEHFARILTPDLGYGVVEEGQFQMKVGAFRKVAADAHDA